MPQPLPALVDAVLTTSGTDIMPAAAAAAAADIAAPGFADDDDDEDLEALAQMPVHPTNSEFLPDSQFPGLELHLEPSASLGAGSQPAECSKCTDKLSDGALDAAAETTRHVSFAIHVTATTMAVAAAKEADDTQAEDDNMPQASTVVTEGAANVAQADQALQPAINAAPPPHLEGHDHDEDDEDADLQELANMPVHPTESEYPPDSLPPDSGYDRQPSQQPASGPQDSQQRQQQRVRDESVLEDFNVSGTAAAAATAATAAKAVAACDDEEDEDAQLEELAARPVPQSSSFFESEPQHDPDLEHSALPLNQQQLQRRHLQRHQQQQQLMQQSRPDMDAFDDDEFGEDLEDDLDDHLQPQQHDNQWAQGHAHNTNEEFASYDEGMEEAEQLLEQLENGGRPKDSSSRRRSAADADAEVPVPGAKRARLDGQTAAQNQQRQSKPGYESQAAAASLHSPPQWGLAHPAADGAAPTREQRWLPQTVRNLAGSGTSAAVAAAAAAHAAYELRVRPRLMASEVQGGRCMHVTSASGARVYCGVRQAVGAACSSRIMAGGGGVLGSSRLLRQSVTELMQAVEEQRLQAVIAESDRIQQVLQGVENDAAIAAAMETDEQEGAAAAGVRSARHRRTSSTSGHAEQLWVDKYAPRRYQDLLSDEQTNREVAKWMKAWEPCVFGSTGWGGLASTSAPNQPTDAAGGGVGNRSSRGGASNGRGGRGGETLQAAALRGRGVGADRRPEHKVVLIAGPPGLGKTTLAHVVAAHCGYHPFEINASDDRTASSLTQKVQDAVQMQAVLGQKRPNCVIIDEIDGATGGAEAGGAVAALIKIVQAVGKTGSKAAVARTEHKARKSGGGGDQEGDENEDSGSGDDTAAGARPAPSATAATVIAAKGRKGKKAAMALSRPIICICNDLYVPALRPLRDVAKVLAFPPPAADKLVARLKLVCEMEGLKVDKQALSLLTERTDCDIRACLNTLQFLSKRTAHVHPGDIDGLNVGAKDSKRSAFDIWHALMWSRARLRRPAGAGSRSSSSSSGGGAAVGGSGGDGWRLDTVCNMVSEFGEYELVMSGLHENMLSLRYMDINLRRTSDMADTLARLDSMMRSCRRTGDFGLLRYIPPALYFITATAAQPERPNIVWPKAGADAARKLGSNTEMLQAWAAKVAPAALQACGARTLMMDVVPCLRALLSPSLRAVAPHLMTPTEAATLESTARLMVNYGLSYDFSVDPPPPGWRPGMPKTVLPGSRPEQAPRPLALRPALDTLHSFNSCPAGPLSNPSASAPRATASFKVVPVVVRQMIMQRAQIEAILRAEKSKQQTHEMEAERLAMFEERPEADPAGPNADIANNQSIVKFGTIRPKPSAAPATAAGASTAAGTKAPTASTSKALLPIGKPVPVRKLNWLEAARQATVDKRKGLMRAVAAAAPNAQPMCAAAGKNNNNLGNQVLAVGGGTHGVPAVAGEGLGSGKGGGKVGQGQFAVLYRFNEGYTNAVKRPLLVRELL